MNGSKVIAISGIPGSGKSSLVARVVSLVPGSRAFRIDDYFSPSFIRADKTEWIQNGTRFEDMKTPGLPDDLSSALADPAVSHVILEETRGKFSPETAPFITQLVYLDIPSDIGLARRVLQISENVSNAEAVQYCRHYLHCLPPAIHAIESKIKPQADLILNGLESTESLAATIIEKYNLMGR